MHKMTTPSSRRQLSALFAAAGQPGSGVTHIATAAIATVLNNDDDDTIMRAMSDAADQMAANGHPLETDPPAPPAPATPDRAPRDDDDDVSIHSPTGAEAFDDEDTNKAKALIKELEDFRAPLLDQTCNFGTVTITGDKGETKEIMVTACLYNTLARKFYALDGKLDHNTTTKSLAQWCNKHQFVDTGNMAIQMQSFKSEIKDSRTLHIYTSYAEGNGFATHALNAVDLYFNKNDSKLLIPYTNVVQTVDALICCLNSYVDTGSSTNRSLLAEQFALLSPDEPNGLRARRKVLQHRIKNLAGEGVDGAAVRETFNASSFRAHDDPGELLSTFITRLKDAADQANLAILDDEATEAAITEQHLVDKVKAQLAITKNFDTTVRYDHNLADLAAQLKAKTLKLTTVPSLEAAAMDLETTSRREGWNPFPVYLDSGTIYKSQMFPIYHQLEKRNKESKKRGTRSDPILVNVATNQLPPNLQYPTHTHTSQSKSTTKGSHSTKALFQGSPNPPKQPGVLGKRCTLCGATDHTSWAECPKGPEKTDYYSPYSGFQNAEGKLSCLTCGSFTHRTGDCNQSGYHGQGGPNYTGPPQAPLVPKGHPSTWPADLIPKLRDDAIKKHRTLGTRSRLSNSRSAKATKGNTNTHNDWGASSDEEDPASGLEDSDSDNSAPPPPKMKHRQAVQRSSGLGRSGFLDNFFCGPCDNKYHNHKE